jgi:hypothetical protein
MDGELWRGHDSVSIVVEEGKHAPSASIQALWMLGRGPGPLVFPCLSERDEWPTTSVFGILGKTNTRLFRGSLLWNVPTRLQAFPGAIRGVRNTS